MLEGYLRPPVQHFLINPLSEFLHTKLRVSPNACTGLAALCGFLFIPALLKVGPVAAAGMLLLSGIFDAADGTIARMTSRSSKKGTILDIIADRFVESCVFIGLYLVHPTEGFIVLLMMAATLLCVTSFLAVGVFTPNDSDKGMHYSSGLIERLEAFAFFTLMVLWPSGFVGLAIAYTALVLLTTAVRIDEFSN